MEKNLSTYTSDEVVKWYRDLEGLLPVEEKVFEAFPEKLKGSVLDIGVGGGRTTAWLQGKCGAYTGIDYSDKFVETVRLRFPTVDCRLMDARDLSAFKNASFDLVNFSFNGIDYMNAEDRKKCLSEINRVLKPGGIFFFSTHNKDHESFHKAPWLSPSNSLLINLKTFLKLLPYLPRKIRNKQKEILNNDHAIINDAAHQYGLFTFYTSLDFLREQLNDTGFHDILLYKKDGSLVNPGSPADDWVFATAFKP